MRILTNEREANRVAVFLKQEEMKPCPFCSSRNVKVEFIPSIFTTIWMKHFFIECLGCGARGPYATAALEAIASWNERDRPLE